MAVTRITSQDILDGTIINVDISSSAQIDPLKIGNPASGVTSGNFGFLSGVGSQVDGISDTRTLTNKTITGSTNTVAARYLFTAAGTVLSVDSTTPTSGQVLAANAAATALTWQTLTAGGGLSISNFVFNEVPTGTPDGVRTQFLLANSTTATGSVRVFKNGLRMYQGLMTGNGLTNNDYYMSGVTGVIFSSANIPQTSDVIIVDYMK